MGNSRWDSNVYTSYTHSVSSVPREKLYASREVKKHLEPRQIQVRESRDSEANPQSTPIIVALDVTGSMGVIAEKMAKKSLGIMVEEILDRKPVSDPHVMFMAIGDAVYDKSPLQVTQFEADTTIIPQLTDLYLEGGGGGNRWESYDLAWAFAAHKTKTDAWEKRKTKGYLFTIGDEMFPHTPNTSYPAFVGIEDNPQLTPETVLEQAQERYHVFHIIVAEGSFASQNPSRVHKEWTEKLQKRALLLNNYEYISEVIVSAIAVSEGQDPQEVIDSWQDDKIRNTVETALTGK